MVLGGAPVDQKRAKITLLKAHRAHSSPNMVSWYSVGLAKRPTKGARFDYGEGHLKASRHEWAWGEIAKRASFIIWRLLASPYNNTRTNVSRQVK